MLQFRLAVIASSAQPPPSLKSCWLKNVMKLGGCQENFKVTLLERPLEKSCSTSKHAAWTAVSVKNYGKLYPIFLDPIHKSKKSKQAKQAIYANNKAKHAS